MTRRRITYAVIGALMAVTVGHVAAFTGSMEPQGWQWLGWLYALAVDLAIVMCGAFTRWKTTRAWAWSGYFAFIGASGALNIAAVQPWTQTLMWAAWIYALFPTCAIALLGFLARDVELLAERSERAKHRTTQPAQPAQPEPQSNGRDAHRCAWCSQAYDTRQALSAHLRWCAAYQEHQHQEAEAIAT